MSYEDYYAILRGDPERLQRDVKNDTKITKDDLLNDMLHQSAIRMTWGYVRSLAERDAKHMKAHLNDEIFADAKATAEKELIDSGRKVSETAKADMARSSRDYCMVRSKLHEAEMLADIMKRVCEALDHKLDMMQSLNSRQREEFKAYPAEFVPKMSVTDGMFAGAEEETQPANSNGSTVEDHRDDGAPMEEQVADLAGRWREMRRKKRESE